MPCADPSKNAAVVDDIDPAGPSSNVRADQPRKHISVLREMNVGHVAMVGGAVRGPSMPVTLWPSGSPGSGQFSFDTLSLG